MGEAEGIPARPKSASTWRVETAQAKRTERIGMNESKEAPVEGGRNPAEQTRTSPPPPREHSSAGRRALIFFVTAAAAFLLGLVPMWFTARAHARERDAARREVRLNQVQLALASAAIDARRGEYEPARLSAVSFFTSLTGELGRGDNSAYSPAQREGLQPLFQQRDDLITLLARSDPASAELLANLYVAYRKAVGK
jgi:hypothetical protein